jgi:hypothetical protein
MFCIYVRSIVIQLLSKFQSTNFTPRNFSFVNTPTVAAQGGVTSRCADELCTLGSPAIASGYIDPNCFEMDDMKSVPEMDSASDRPFFSSDELAIGAAISVARQIIDGNITPDIRALLSEPLESSSKKRNRNRNI